MPAVGANQLYACDRLFAHFMDSLWVAFRA